MASTLRFLLLAALCMGPSAAQHFVGTCDKPRNADLPFCDSSLSFDERVADLVSRLTLDEKLGLMDNNQKGAAENVDLDPYEWWGEGLHGVAYSPAVHFREPTNFATSFPQPISTAQSFNKQLFFEVANATGNEGRAFYNVGNAGLSFWSPNVDIFRDPRWGRGHESQGEDPRLAQEYAKAFVKGMQGEGEAEGGFVKMASCCKHYKAYGLENGRFSFNGIVTEQDLADTYLPPFKTCVTETGAISVMSAYHAINGIPTVADKAFTVDTVKGEWGFDGYVVSDCAAIDDVLYRHHYTETESETCAVVLDAGLDLECHWGDSFFDRFLRQAVEDGAVAIETLDKALFNTFKVLMRLGHFEQDATRPFKELVPSMVDNAPHQALALRAARESIVLLKNAPNAKTGKPVLPLDKMKFAHKASMAIIGPFVHAQNALLGNYNGRPSFVRSPFEEIRRYVPDLEAEVGCNVTNFENPRLQEAEDLARSSEQVVVIIGNSIEVEAEDRDRANISLHGLQTELIRRVLDVVQEPIIMFVITGGALDLEEYVNDPRVSAIILAGYLGQSAGEAMADVMFGAYNPAGRLTQTFYPAEFIDQVPITDMDMRPVNGKPGRTYRFYTGRPTYAFGHGLSYTTFAYSFGEQGSSEGCAITVEVRIRNSGQRAGDHSVLWFLAPPNAGLDGRPIKSLLDFERSANIQPGQEREVRICLTRDDFQLANQEGEFLVVPGEWKLLVENLERSILVV